ncbi:MAG: 50S ribosomal protein L9 [bacterium]|nr:50S ribosomal protein L9 [bacterium]
MKVVLTRDVKGMGRAHEAVETKDGYALNFLIPQKLAIPATPAALKEAERRQVQTSQRKELDVKLLAENIAALAEVHITIAMKANEKGHLYEAVAAPEISHAVKEQAHIDLPEEAIKLEKPIKELGTFRVPISAGEAFGEFSIEVVAE